MSRRSGWRRPAVKCRSSSSADPAFMSRPKDAFKPTPVGSCELAGFDPDFGTELGAMLLDRAPGRVSDQQITTYKAMGIAMEDMVAADLAYRCARRVRKGKLVVL
ncbi:hypothetical protein [Mesorhizobium sp.]|uniref:hypothetical protein n=1 Tax=Mesorhizobium sp. TaxID=1871066 RepID=UPI00338EEB1E